MSGLVAGRYRVVEALGGGGTSLVHRGEDVTGGPDVALKLLRPQFAHDPALRRRFLREAELVRGLDHPGIVRVLDVGVDEDAPFLVLELVRAETLRQLLDRAGPLPPARARAILEALARALDHAHARGVLHRDVKPQNVFVGEDLVKLGDFGNARVVSLASVTGASLTWGTPEYVAPELFMRGRADPRSDFYALGVVFHEMLTGRLPWTRAETLTRLGAPARAAAAFAPTGAGSVDDRLIAQLLSRSPSDRPASGGELLAQLSPLDAVAVTRKLACSACGAPRPEDVPRCVVCGQEILRLHHDPAGPWRLVLRSLGDDAASLEAVMRVLEPLVEPVGRPLLFLTGNRSLYSQAELTGGISLPAVLLSALDEGTARELANLGRAGGLDVDAYEGTCLAESRGKASASWWGVMLPIAVTGLTTGAMLHSLIVGVSATAALVASFVVALRLRTLNRLRRAQGALELRECLEVRPAAEGLLAGAVGAATRVRAPEARALFADVSIELYRLTRRAEQLRARAGGRSSELELIERTLAAAPALVERLGRLAAHLDALDAALEGTTEGELMQALARIERGAAAPGADRVALAAARRDLEATLERRGAAEQERARLAAALCELLGAARHIYRRAAALETLDDRTAAAVEEATAALDHFLAGADERVAAR